MHVIRYFLNMVPYMAAALPVFLIARFFFRKGKFNIYHEIGLLFFVLYLVGLSSQTIIPKIQFGLQWLDIPERDFSTVNLVPFMIFKDSFQMWRETGSLRYFITNFLGNMVVFYPLGFFPALLWPKINCSVKRAVILGLYASCFVEFCQLFLNRGTDIDDVILNTLGAVTGYGIFLLLRRFFPNITGRFAGKE